MFGKTRVHLNKLHFSVRRALKIIEPYFIPLIVVEQDMLGNKQRMDKFLDSIPTKEIRNEVGLLLEKYTSSLDRWQAFLIYIKTEIESVNIFQIFVFINYKIIFLIENINLIYFFFL